MEAASGFRLKINSWSKDWGWLLQWFAMKQNGQPRPVLRNLKEILTKCFGNWGRSCSFPHESPLNQYENSISRCLKMKKTPRPFKTYSMNMYLAGEAYGEGKFRTGCQSPLFGSLSVNSEPFTRQTEQGKKSFFLWNTEPPVSIHQWFSKFFGRSRLSVYHQVDSQRWSMLYFQDHYVKGKRNSPL